MGFCLVRSSKIGGQNSIYRSLDIYYMETIKFRQHYCSNVLLSFWLHKYIQRCVTICSQLKLQTQYNSLLDRKCLLEGHQRISLLHLSYDLWSVFQIFLVKIPLKALVVETKMYTYIYIAILHQKSATIEIFLQWD